MPRQRDARLARFAASARDAAAGRPVRAGRLRRRELHVRRRDLALPASRRPLRRPHRRPRRQARRFRGPVHVRRVPDAAIPARTAWRQAAGPLDRVGQPAARSRRPALVPSLSRRAHRLPRRTALDAARAELELHVRGLSLDGCAQGLRRGQQPLPDAVLRDIGRLRGVPRPRLGAPRLGPGQGRRSAARPHRAVRRAARRHLAAGRDDGQAATQPAAHQRAGNRRVRPVSRPSRPTGGGLPSGAAVRRPLPACAADAPALSRGRPAAGRGLHLGLLAAEPHACRGRHLQRLPRSALAEAARAGGRRLRPVPRAGEIRSPLAPRPRPGQPRVGVCRLPHAAEHLHGHRPAA